MCGGGAVEGGGGVFKEGRRILTRLPKLTAWLCGGVSSRFGRESAERVRFRFAGEISSPPPPSQAYCAHAPPPLCALQSRSVLRLSACAIP